MTSERLSVIAEKVHAITCYQVGSTRVSPSSNQADYNSICTGLVLWFGILLDYNTLLCGDTQIHATEEGRILKCPLPLDSTGAYPLDILLSYLDGLNDILLDVISEPGQFKADHLVKRVVKGVCDPAINAVKGIICSFMWKSMNYSTHDKDASVQFIKLSRQVFGFFKKLDIDRPELSKATELGVLDFEVQIAQTVSVQALDPCYIKLVSDMRKLYRKHMDCFKIAPFAPKHGPGAVSDTSVKCWYDKNMSACTDARIKRLLGTAGLGVERDWLPYLKDVCSDRTSRFISVPKTWKKLRGISAEPAELQFWQQGLLHSIDRMFTTDKWWASRIALHRQELSRSLAELNSLTLEHATIDLSAASDSVSTQLVRDVFKNTVLGRWLLGTRSTHILCGTTTKKLSKFAPMGSATCFPVECIIFTLAAEIACSRTYLPSLDYRGQVRVYGDDIILPCYAVHELFSILSTLGFTVNSEKSYWEGSFREACGTEAWRGVDIRPCRFKSNRTGVHCSILPHDDSAMLVSLANEFYARGLHTARAWLLTILFRKYYQLPGAKVCVQHTLFVSFDGKSSTLTSPCPTNFQVKRKYSQAYHNTLLLCVIWRERPILPSNILELSSIYADQMYTAWLISHQAGLTDFDKMWIKGYLVVEDASPYSRLPIGMKMVPTFKWSFPVSNNCIDQGKASKDSQI